MQIANEREYVASYTSKRFEIYLKLEWVHHEHTIPKTPEQNDAAERINRTVSFNAARCHT